MSILLSFDLLCWCTCIFQSSLYPSDFTGSLHSPSGLFALSISVDATANEGLRRNLWEITDNHLKGGQFCGRLLKLQCRVGISR
ncbi:uncharacterized protein BT62DRAFT_939069 [Guyanagaster necrorhizus]|uniref:Secreted protein n=1 Tax=Guyanagaster necrorhizus TaxID=856835 RepID=A0A9P7VEY8_9AGAR|nr:uncharacterized protein BT62DRAFT_939065 [Guyanagaster necrorhizus MCA 3950]XP_043032835.1 uncharacterized protein BT62DRAFT_939069 [Guyanagaster necrorhizus MCA 3950]KAG7439328.1 hypothetical protein BT62DRAFT_939065 [Guyanagaster necrorhizus MCA 3950]KAG7439335.1 hypothetical protein BT62DRAFT_939069 [Guyanagaster necrorhizus MCA 3950]